MNNGLSGDRPLRRIAALFAVAVLLLVGLRGPGAALRAAGAAGDAAGGAVDNSSAGGEILYEENFDGIADGQLPEGWTVSPALRQGGGSAAVRNKALRIDASNVELGKVLLPESLAQYGNYTVEADVTFVSSRDSSRWCSLVFRQQSTDEAYYHMCVRRDATAANGIEFAARSPGAWNVLTTGSAPEKSDTAHLKVSVYGDSVYEYYNGELIIASNALSSLPGYYRTGGIGIQANFTTLDVDNVRVTALLEDPEEDARKENANKHYVAQERIYTAIISPATVVTEIGDMESLRAALAESPVPQVLILYLDDELRVTDATGAQTVGTAQEVMDVIGLRTVPAFYVRSEAAAEGLCRFLKENNILDAFVMSDQPELVKQVRADRGKIRGILDFTRADLGEMTQEKLDAVIETTNANLARVALLPQSAVSKADVEYLQHRLLTVWIAEDAARDVWLHNAIQSGANGIVTDTPQSLFAAYDFYGDVAGDSRVLVRNPLLIGHRGLPSAAPENSLESAQEAVRAGADCLEIDVRLTKDGVVVIYHDDDLSSLTNGTGRIGSHTYEELCRYDLLRSSTYGTFEKYPRAKIATLEEYFQTFRDDDVMFFIEIKEDTAQIAPKTAELVRQYHMENRIAVITFLANQVPAWQKEMPGTSVGLLCTVPNGLVTEDVVENIFRSIGARNTTFNATGIGDYRLIRGLMNRGITCWPWTYGATTTASAYLLGVGGITTDYANVVGTVPTEIRVDGGMEYTLNLQDKRGKSVTYTPTVYNRFGVCDLSGKYTDTGAPVGRPELIVLDGAECIEVKGNTVTAKATGEAHLMYRYVASTEHGRAPTSQTSFSLYTGIMTVRVESNAVPGGTGALGSGAVAAICIAAAAVLAAAAVGICVWRRRRAHAEK